MSGLSEGHFVKVRLPDKKEARIINVSGFSEPGFTELRQKTKEKFGLTSDDFYYLYKDPTEDMVSIRTADDYMVLYKFCTATLGKNRIGFQFTLVLPSEQRETTNQQQQQSSSSSNAAPTSSIEESFLNIFQSVINNIESGISNLQQTVEKSTTTAADKLAQAAAETAANVYRSVQQPQQQPQPQNGDGTTCGVCSSTIKGKSWRCLTCDNINLCSSCKSGSKHDPNHNLRCTKTDRCKEKEPLFNTKHIAAICDYCNSLIEGTRHKCLVCPDFDFCHTCYVIAKDSHYDHPFQTILQHDDKKTANSNKKKECKRKSSKCNKALPIHFGVNCDNCQAIIKGVRYKCGHCSNYDLCESCERLPCHNESHAFIKIKNPIQSVSLEPLLPKFVELQMKNEVPPSSSSPPPPPQADTKSNGRCRRKKTSSSSSSASVKTNSSKGSSRTVSSHSSKASAPTIVVPEVKNHASLTIDPKPTLSASFVVDMNYPDGTVVSPKTTFVKMWKMKNTGNEAWPVGSQLVYHSGDILRSYPSAHPYGFAVPSVGPAEETCVVAELESPEKPGEYTSYFSVTSPEGTRFGDVLWCTIRVVEDHVEQKEEEPVVVSNPIIEEAATPGECSMIYPVLMHDSSSDIHHQVPNEMTETSTQQRIHNDDDDDEEEETFSLASSDMIQVQEVNPFEDNASTLSSSSPSIRTHSSRNSTSSSRSGRSQRTGSYASSDDFIMVDSDKEEEEDDDAEDENDDDYVEDEDQQVPEEHTKTDTPQSTTILTQERQPSFTSSPSARSIGSNTDSNTFEDALTGSQYSEVRSESGLYKAQLLQIHEMGFTHCDELTLHLLQMYDGAIDKVVPKLLETLYP